MIREVTGDMFRSDAAMLVNPVNTFGVSGAGLALRFKQLYPASTQEYARVCRRGGLRPGGVFVTDVSCRLIAHLATKRHWKEPSELRYITNGVAALAREISAREVASVAVPALGCGLGELDWKRVRRIIVDGLADSEADVVLYAPHPIMPRRRAPARPQTLLSGRVSNMRRGRLL